MNKNKKHPQGIALLVVLSTIALLTILMYAFQYETTFDQIRSYNIQDHLQAKLNAESGVHLAMMRLEIYKEAYNQLQQNKEYKKFVSANALNEIWSMPMMFPIPKTSTLSVMESGFIDKFEEQSWLTGQLQISIESLGSKLNLNMLAESKLRTLRTKKATTNSQQGAEPTPTPAEGATTTEAADQTEVSKLISDKLLEMLERAINQKKESDEEFYQRYSSKDLNYLVQAIKYYVSDDNTDIGPLTTQLEADFQKNGINAKHAPMSSISEILLLPEWNDDLLNLIKNEISVNDSLYLDLNKMTDSFLKMLSPEITQNQITQFFKLKNDPNASVSFNGKEDFVNFMGSQIRVDDKALQDTMEGLEKIGFKFTNSPNLFRIKSVGIFGRSEVTLTVTVLLPEKVEAKKAGTETSSEGTEGKTTKEEKPIQFDLPRIIETSQS